MATTTTNFGWDIPQSTDLVKDGATAIAALGQDIDTAFVDLKGGTTGQVLAKASGTDLDFSWVAQDDSNAIQNTIVDAKGDIIAATASDTPARLAVGTNGQVLTADSAEATGLKWSTVSSGGMTLLSTTTLSGASTTISSISQSYKTLVFVITGMTSAAGNGQFFGAPNNNTSSIQFAGVQGSGATGGANGKVVFNLNNSLGSDANNAWVLQIDNYTSSTAFKPVEWYGRFIENDSSSKPVIFGGVFSSTTAVSSMVFTYSAGNFSGGTVLTYGVS
jgi:hypothetical protein